MAHHYGQTRQSCFLSTGDCPPELDAQKKSLSASERDEAARAAWRAAVEPEDVRRLVFLDESGSHLAMTSAYARASRGERAVGVVPKNRGRNTTILGAIGWAGWQIGMVLEGAADRDAFEVFIARYLVPTLQPGQIVVLDNLNIHKGVKVREMIEEAGCTLLFLPTYSPDFNPIELAWSKLKAFLRRVGARTRESLDAAIGQGLGTITTQDARHWFAHCGYHLI